MTTNPILLVRDPRDPRDDRGAAERLRAPIEAPSRSGAASKPAPGPCAGLVGLPQPDRGQLTTPEGLDDHLFLLEEARQAQLAALPAIPGDAVAAAHRGTVSRILEQVRAARRRLSDGLYGICAGCGSGIHPERLELRPWLTTCTACVSSDRA